MAPWTNRTTKISEFTDLRDDAEANKEAIEKAEQELKNTLLAKQITGGLQLFGNFLGLIPEIGPIISTVINSAAGMVENFGLTDDSGAVGTIQAGGEQAAEAEGSMSNYLESLPDEQSYGKIMSELVENSKILPSEFDPKTTQLTKLIQNYNLNLAQVLQIMTN